MTLSDSSCGRWITRLQSGDDAAVEKLWSVYFEKLVRMAHRRLQTKYRRIQDAEDVALSAFETLCRGARQHRYPSLTDHHGLWKLLVTITMNKVRRIVRDQTRVKRGGMFRDVTDFDESTNSLDMLNHLVSREPTPEFAVQVAEQYRTLLEQLPNGDLAEIAAMKLEGYTNSEIAERSNRSERTIERKLNLIRKLWLHATEQSPG
jgi:DNA-directed RNA polymerase specialized sigma24 family protein